MQLKTILNATEKFKSFVYDSAKLETKGTKRRLLVKIKARKNSKPVCSGCDKRGPTYDTLGTRMFQYLPLFGLLTYFVYTMRRVNCPRCGVKVEKVPWAAGKSPLTTSYAWFLARWARKMSWTEVAKTFSTSWDTVYRAVAFAVEWGLAHRSLQRIRAIGVDEVLFHRGHKYLTVVYQIDAHCRRLLWVGEKRTVKTLDAFFNFFGPRALHLRWACSDMWGPYLSVLKRRAPKAVHVLDRYHIAALLNKALDKVRAGEARRMKAEGYVPVLHKSRWLLLKRPSRLSGTQKSSLRKLLQFNLRTVRAYILKEQLQQLWKYVHPTWAMKFFDRWCAAVMRSRIEPLKKSARTLRKHRELIRNWFEAKGAISNGPVEGLNNKLKTTFRKSYGFRGFKVAEIALYHSLGKLPEPPGTHRFC